MTTHDQNLIPVSEIEYHPLSFADPNGRLFWWQGQLYRGLTARRAEFYRQLFESGVIQRLMEKGWLVQTELTDLQLPGYAIILRHAAVPFVSYPFEWCAEMLRDAALLLVELEIELASQGLALQDGHSWNVLYEGCRPVFVDFGSIVPLKAADRWHAFDEYRRFNLFPLLLMGRGQGRMARALLHDHEQGISRVDLKALKSSAYYGYKLRLAWLRCLGAFQRQHPAAGAPTPPSQSAGSQARCSPAGLQARLQMKQLVSSLKLPAPRTDWSNYYDSEYPSLTPAADWTAKHRTVHEVLLGLRPGSVLDVGSNRGWYAQLAARSARQVVAFDIDETCVAQLFNEAKAARAAILPLVMNFCNPSPGYGVCNEWLAPATQRLKCDLVIALALVHHLVFKARLRFEQIVAGLSVFAKRGLLVEFVPREDRYVREWWNEDYAWYTVENFQTALGQYFRQVKRLPSFPEPRLLWLCER